MTSTAYLLPGLPFGGSEITIVRWLKRPGERVAVGEPLLVVVNDRLEAALPATRNGILERLLVAEGAPLAADTPVATIAAEVAANASDTPKAVRSSVPAIDRETRSEARNADVTSPALRVTPVARRIASTTEIDITVLRGSGVSGRIVKADVLAALAAYQPPTEHHPLTRSPPRADDTYVITAIDVEMERLLAVIARLEPAYVRRGLELSLGACVALGVLAALPRYPLLNSCWSDDAIVIRRRVHLTVAPGNGLATRLICDAQDLNLRGLARALGIRAPVASTSHDSTFAIADLGDQVWGDPAALASGRSAALGFGAVRARPIVIGDGGGDRLAMRRVALMTLAYDARAIDQRYADAFLRELKRRLESFDP
ncbi:MAG TPA: 2-oxo acid dehydrogenase subunit E2 [Roseiflexaceae bacterium]|nr:2-oxo acid dehydrogenase subunit E2 [Roseiflexaceae bacterium]